MPLRVAAVNGLPLTVSAIFLTLRRVEDLVANKNVGLRYGWSLFGGATFFLRAMVGALTQIAVNGLTEFERRSLLFELLHALVVVWRNRAQHAIPEREVVAVVVSKSRMMLIVESRAQQGDG